MSTVNKYIFSRSITSLFAIKSLLIILHLFLTMGFYFFACVGRCVEVGFADMPILSIKATKPSSNTRLGFTCRKAKEGTSLLFIITSVDPLGLFGGTDLRCGQQLLRINGISLKEVDVDGIKDILSSELEMFP